MAKAALNCLTKGAALELAPQRIRVNTVAPGIVPTNFMAATGLPDEATRGFIALAEKATPLGRVGAPEDIAHAVAFLADDSKSGWVTGSTLGVDGGILVRSSLD
jgi:NAD(P)-dependent dehydrogenase (short-subunit alcohol dehydrogenase family)